MPKPGKYQLPDFLSLAGLTQVAYEKWLNGRAVAHVKRDKGRGNTKATNEVYKIAIHRAVIHSGGVDWYTGELLDWSLIGRYRNEESKAKRRSYKAAMALMPSIDHVSDGLGDAEFKISALRTNGAKSDLTHAEFVSLCRRVVAHFDQALTVQEAQTMGQREKMRFLIDRFGDKEETVCKEYAEAERKGKVSRKKGKNKSSPEEYARALYRDAHRKDGKRWS